MTRCNVSHSACDVATARRRQRRMYDGEVAKFLCISDLLVRFILEFGGWRRNGDVDP